MQVQLSHTEFTLLVATIVIFVAIFLLFYWTVYSSLKLVPDEKRTMPAWTAWLMIIPLVGLIFSWILLPFSVPRSLAAATADNPTAVEKTKTLFGLGLAYVILITIGIIPMIGLIAVVASFVIILIYWYKLVKFKKKHLQKAATHKVG